VVIVKLSDKMQETYEIIKEHGEIIRWGECYWTYPKCARSKRLDVPEWICQTSTLRALAKRNLITLDEDNDIARVNLLN